METNDQNLIFLLTKPVNSITLNYDQKQEDK